MSKRKNSQFPQVAPRPLIQKREQPPIPLPTEEGIALLCPFCDDHHRLFPNVESPCGTHIEVMAVQEVISKKLAREEKLVCIKCHLPGGEFVRYLNSFVHAHNCSPGTKLLQETPKFSLLAKWVFGLPESFRKNVEKATGQADQVREIDEHGNPTGKILGYFFRAKRKLNAKQTPA